ncbi:hypothetical protein [Cellulomonas sp. C5510]|uniref:hypothetical protein n=1 Tax=Cellulomonas sp. C5510 TaxID=2871170 RepID=UPI001C98B40A|nr:hypothetical protein [Cellulomonas sp. C5510]QZN85356.1 hypothetical protein K5O09_16565 [Cellulomonas sp. C5510]
MTGVTRPGRPGRATLALAGPVVAAAFLLAGCASGDADAGSGTTEPPADDGTADVELVAGSSGLGVPAGLGGPPADAAAGAARTADAGLLYVVTFGSSTCPQVADPEATATGDAAVEVTFPEPAGDPCTTDYVPATSVVALPDGVDPDADLTVTVGSWGDVTLPAGSQDPAWATAEG